MGDPYGLQRFVEAQDSGDTYAQATAELRAGRKRSHWMWFVFPQVSGLGSSPTARRYAVSGLREAAAYAAHPVLGARLRESVALVLALPPGSAETTFGALDAMKLRSSMTLFAEAVPEDGTAFTAVLDRHFGGRRDEATLQLLR